MSGARAGFSEAARLYAENAKLVEAMEKAFRSNVAQVIEAARVEAERLVREQMGEPGRGIQHKLVGKSPDKKWPWMIWRYAEADADLRAGPYVWFYTTDPEIVVPGSIEVTVSSGNVSKPDRTRFLAVKSELSVPTRAGEDKGLFTFDAACAGPDPAAQIAAAVAPVLVGLRRVERGLGRA